MGSMVVHFYVLYMLVMVPISFSAGDINDQAISHKVKGCPFDRIFSFGGSSTDTGNLLLEDHRSSNGLLIVDYLSSAFHLPSPKPYLMEKKDGMFYYGANFAVDGATARSTTNISLNVQIDWFLTNLSSICSSHNDCSKNLQRAVFLVGDFGSTDYNSAFVQGKIIKDVASSLVPQVVKSIKDGIMRLIDAGAVNLMVPGVLPMGCLPDYLTKFHSDDPMSYEHSTKCLRGFNTFSKVHNYYLAQALRELGSQHPHVQIVYLDYYKAYKALLRNHVRLGFEESSLGKSCRSSAGTVCSNPNDYVHWDGINLTQKANNYMVEGFVTGKFIYPKNFNLPERSHCVM